ncbi:4a-hydroxytetrahydrobiopterin dehydratase [Flavimobilis soli]|uniref:Putative pterin-4-alpha-carbinolamine dehydratase n=1 Tax=Flavimobilis soli TaxID=442709 RepID=A0A2A9EFN7_9MICO|nr:4a-hydroxytetrahydrobiopterin dehydratase [Flavimobilis soli]PFG37738.1 4a-hydroxytetrahydrobiopterin dehydratase [Flavimobilis soli]
MEPLDNAHAQEAVYDAGWRVVAGAIRARFTTGTFVRGVELVERLTSVAEAQQHHPDVALRYTHVDVALTTHDVGAITSADVDLALEISQVAQQLGIGTAEVPSVVEIGIDAMVSSDLAPFWRAVLGYEGDDEDLADPHGAMPGVWFQQMDEPRPQRNRLHLDVYVPHDVVQARLEAALAAGGTLVTDRFAPSWWVVADTEGNEACLCTWQPKPDAGEAADQG